MKKATIDRSRQKTLGPEETLLESGKHDKREAYLP